MSLQDAKQILRDFSSYEILYGRVAITKEQFDILKQAIHIVLNSEKQ